MPTWLLVPARLVVDAVRQPFRRLLPESTVKVLPNGEVLVPVLPAAANINPVPLWNNLPCSWINNKSKSKPSFLARISPCHQGNQVAVETITIVTIRVPTRTMTNIAAIRLPAEDARVEMIFLPNIIRLAIDLALFNERASVIVVIPAENFETFKQ